MPTTTQTTTATRRKIIFEHDPDPDFSWLEQPCQREPVWRTEADMKAGKPPLNPDWYCNPANHVALCMAVLEFPTDADDWQVVDSLGNIDFMADSDDWATGTFYRVSALPDGYLRELAREAGLPE